MKHYGDITKINGAEVPIVDIICGGSPCQDLSVAGKRAGLDGERSGLFMEQIRIVKEQRDECIRQLQMRGANVDLRLVKPRFLIWENVPGALSSPGVRNGENHKGEDFRCVLEEICRIADKTANVPLPKDRKWSNSGLIVGDGWSVGWRVHDSQFWGRTVLDNTGRVVKMGTPQRRRRISVVADFGSESIGEILFERESVSGDSEPSIETGKEIAGTVGDGVKTASNVFGDDVMPTLVSRLETPVGNTQDGFNVISFQERAGKEGGGKGILIQDEKTASLRTATNQSILTVDEKMGQTYVNVDMGNTLSARDYKQPQAVCCLNDQGGQQMTVTDDKTGTLRAEEHGHQPAVCYGMDNERRRGPEEHHDESPTITAKCGTGGNNVPIVIEGNGSRESHKGDGYKESEVSYTLNSTEVHGVCTEPVLLANNQNGAEVSQTGVCNTLPASAGMGGGYVPMITDSYQKTTGALCASGYDKLGTQEAMNDMYVVSHGGFMTDADNSGTAHTLQATDYKDPQVVAYGLNRERGGAVVAEEICPTIQAAAGTSGNNQPMVAYGLDSYNQTASEEKADTLRTNGGGDNTPKVAVAYGLDRASFNQGQNAKFNFSIEEELSPTLVNRGPGGVLTKQ